MLGLPITLELIVMLPATAISVGVDTMLIVDVTVAPDIGGDVAAPASMVTPLLAHVVL